MKKTATSEAHTAGPWTVKEQHGFLRIVDKQEECIACVSDIPRGGANANVIAAAPLLLKFAQGVVGQIAMIDRKYLSEELAEQLTVLNMAANVVISKATSNV